MIDELVSYNREFVKNKGYEKYDPILRYKLRVVVAGIRDLRGFRARDRGANSESSADSVGYNGKRVCNRLCYR